MPHINLPEGIQGILGPMAFSPQTAKPLNELAEVLLRAPNSLTQGEREMIATYVSSQNDCFFCQTVHGAAAAYYLGGKETLIDQLKRDFESAPVSDKLKALLAIARKVQKGGKQVTDDDVDRAKTRRDRQGNSRHGSDRRRVLHVQSLCGWPSHVGAARSAALSRERQAHRRRRLYPLDRSFAESGFLTE
jgi:alkylhydroperoxidase family enzyme